MPDPEDGAWDTASLPHASPRNGRHKREGNMLPTASGLPPLWIAVLLLAFHASSNEAIAKRLGIEESQVAEILDHPLVRERISVVEQAVVAKLQAGEFGIGAIAKHHAPQAMRNIVRLANKAHDERVRLQASKDVVNYAGYEPAKVVKLLTKEEIILKMTVPELDAFLATKKLPERFEPEHVNQLPVQALIPDADGIFRPEAHPEALEGPT
jgi:hypothetical protein